MPEEPGALNRHEAVSVTLTLVTPQGEKPALVGRTVTQHLRPNGTIVQVRPLLQRPFAVKRGDAVTVRLSRGLKEPLHTNGEVSWVRERAFMPSGLAVSLVGVTFAWDADEMALEVAAFLGA